jgi:hypothetical protein
MSRKTDTGAPAALGAGRTCGADLRRKEGVRTMKLSRLALTSAVLFAALGLNIAAWGQEGPDGKAPAWPKKPPFSLRIGTYFSNVATRIRIDGERGFGTEIDLSSVLKIPRTATIFRANGEFRIFSWFGVEAEYYRINRSKVVAIDQEFVAGDIVFAINDTVSAKYRTSYLDFALKFSVLHRERLDLGFWVGAKVHFLQLELENQSAELGSAFVNRKTWYPVPAGGMQFVYSLLPRLYLYGKAGYFSYKISDAKRFNNTRYDISLDYYVWRSLGLGATYEYSRSSFSSDNTNFSGLVKTRSSGLQFYAVIGF